VVACALSFSAGALTVLSPCVLPLALIAMTSSLQRHRFGPVALAAGLAVSSTILGLLFAMLGFAVDRDLVRLVAAVLLVVLGLVLLSWRAQGSFARLLAPVTEGAARLLARTPRSGVVGQFLVGTLLGAIWSPCAGPTLAAAITLAAQRTSVPSAALVIAAFSLGAAVPLVALAYASRETLGRRAESIARIARPLTGVALVVVGVLTLSGGDRLIETRLVDVMPGWLMDLTTRF
jgi:cytochrome c-type biogenesis protein